MPSPFLGQANPMVRLTQTAAQWAQTTDHVLQSWEVGLESDTSKAKFGDGGTPWSGLSYWSPGGAVAALAIGSSIASGTAGSVLFAGAAGVLAQNNANFFWDNTNTQLQLIAGAATKTPLVVKGFASQTANLQEWQDSAATVLVKIEKDGTFTSPFIQLRKNGTVASIYNDAVRTGLSGLYFETSTGIMRFASGTQGFVMTPNGGNTQVDYFYGTNHGYMETGSNLDIYPTAGMYTQLGANGVVGYLRVDASAVAGDTRLMLWDVTAAALVRVTRGAVDSGGVGFRTLRVPN